MARCPKRVPQSAQGPSALDSASVRKPPGQKCVIAPGDRSLSCTASSYPHTWSPTLQGAHSVPLLVPL
eukprot:15458834-Alexandrium_andersonii.AAC.1